MAAVAIHELREDLGRYLDRVAHGETLEVLDQGRPVALLSPVPAQETALARLRREGKVTPARLDLLGGSASTFQGPASSASAAVSGSSWPWTRARNAGSKALGGVGTPVLVPSSWLRMR
jgi:prevent-host-death family protein